MYGTTGTSIEAQERIPVMEKQSILACQAVAWTATFRCIAQLVGIIKQQHLLRQAGRGRSAAVSEAELCRAHGHQPQHRAAGHRRAGGGRAWWCASGAGAPSWPTPPPTAGACATPSPRRSPLWARCRPPRMVDFGVVIHAGGGELRQDGAAGGSRRYTASPACATWTASR